VVAVVEDPIRRLISGETTPAGIDANNAETLGVTSLEATEEAINVQSVDDNNAVPFAVSVTGNNSSELSNLVYDIGKKLLNQAPSLNFPTGLTISSDQFGDPSFCGGSISVPDNVDTATSFTITYNNLCYDTGTSGQIVMNGTVKYAETDTTITITYVNFSYTFDGTTETINATLNCDSTFSSCSFSSDYAGSDGKTYRVADFSVGGDDTSGYTVSATFFHPDHGSLSIETTSPMTFGCSNGLPDGGTISFTGDGGTSGTITFRSDCTGYDGTYFDGSVAGSFSGDWS
jgi:hypothetical protein